MKRIRDENGQALIVVALALTCILGFVGFATDVGVLLHAKRNMQIAADAAAIAGAKQLDLSGTVAQIQSAGQAASAQNGVTNGSGGATVAINPPPLNGPNAGKAGYVEAIVQQPQPSFFMRLFSVTSTPVSARAVAFNGATTGTGCLYALNPSAQNTIHLQGSFTLSVPGCEVIDDSISPKALDFTGAGGSLTAAAVGVVGGVWGQVSVSNPPPVTGIAPVSDPLAPILTPPTYSPSSCTAAPTGNTWGPATGGGTVCYSGTLTVSTPITMNPGVYILTGTLNLNGSGSLTGTGVTFYLPGGTPGGTFGTPGAGNATLNLTAPTSGPYNGILIYEDPGNTNPITLIGNPVTAFTGIVYAPSAQLNLGGNTNMTLTTDLIVGTLYDFGNAAITINDYTRTVTTSPLHTIALVE